MAEPTVNLTVKDIQALMIAAIAEAKKPDPAVLKAQEEAEERRLQVVKENLLTAALEDQGRLARQAACSHTKENGRPRTVITYLSDGKNHEMCLWCQKEIRVWEPTKDELVMAS